MPIVLNTSRKQLQKDAKLFDKDLLSIRAEDAFCAVMTSVLMHLTYTIRMRAQRTSAFPLVDSQGLGREIKPKPTSAFYFAQTAIERFTQAMCSLLGKPSSENGVNCGKPTSKDRVIRSQARFRFRESGRFRD